MDSQLSRGSTDVAAIPIKGVANHVPFKSFNELRFCVRQRESAVVRKPGQIAFRRSDQSQITRCDLLPLVHGDSSSAACRCVHGSGGPFKKTACQQHDVFVPRTEGRHDQFESAQAEIQVRSKTVVIDGRFQLLVGGTDDSHVDRDCTRTTNPLDDRFLQGLRIRACAGSGISPTSLRTQSAAFVLFEDSGPHRLP